jgi:glycine cleavage system aminomethyltransferase T
MPVTVVARTPLHAWHAAHGARLTESHGWQVPAGYSTLERELAVARSAVALADLSAFAKVSILGPGVPAFARTLAGDAVSKPCRVAVVDAGGPVLACRLAADHLLLLADTPDLEPLMRQQAASIDVTTAYAVFSLVGPNAEPVLAQLTALDLAGCLPPGACAETGLAGIQALLVRPPTTPLPWVRICVAWDLGEYVWERLLDAGRRHGVEAVGLDALRHAAPWVPPTPSHTA